MEGPIVILLILTWLYCVWMVYKLDKIEEQLETIKALIETDERFKE